MFDLICNRRVYLHEKSVPSHSRESNLNTEKPIISRVSFLILRFYSQGGYNSGIKWIFHDQAKDTYTLWFFSYKIYLHYHFLLLLNRRLCLFFQFINYPVTKDWCHLFLAFLCFLFLVGGWRERFSVNGWQTSSQYDRPSRQWLISCFVSWGPHCGFCLVWSCCG